MTSPPGRPRSLRRLAALLRQRRPEMSDSYDGTTPETAGPGSSPMDEKDKR